MELDISGLHLIDGFLGACVVDGKTGSVLSSVSSDDTMDVEHAGSANLAVMRAMHLEVTQLGVSDDIEDVLISLSEQYHLFRPVTHDRSVFVYVAVDRRQANLAMARSYVRDIESRLRVS